MGGARKARARQSHGSTPKGRGLPGGERTRVLIRGTMSITVYQKPTCTTCRQVYAALRDAKVEFNAVDYYTDPIPRAKLEALIRKMGITPRQLLRTKEVAYRALGLAEPTVTDAQIIDAMVAHPGLIQRPIVEKGDRAILARPPARLQEIL